MFHIVFASIANGETWVNELRCLCDVHDVVALEGNIEELFGDSRVRVGDVHEVRNKITVDVLNDLQDIETIILEVSCRGCGELGVIHGGGVLIQYLVQSLELLKHESNLLVNDEAWMFARHPSKVLPNHEQGGHESLYLSCLAFKVRVG